MTPPKPPALMEFLLESWKSYLLKSFQPWPCSTCHSSTPEWFHRTSEEQISLLHSRREIATGRKITAQYPRRATPASSRSTSSTAQWWATPNETSLSSRSNMASGAADLARVSCWGLGSDNRHHGEEETIWRLLKGLWQGLPLSSYPQAQALRNHWPSQHLDPELSWQPLTDSKRGGCLLWIVSVELGVPQGSVLGPCLILLYIQMQSIYKSLSFFPHAITLPPPPLLGAERFVTDRMAI